MENIINGKLVNKRFIGVINRRCTELFDDARPFIESSNAEDVVDHINDDNYVKKEDREEYDILMTLLSYLDYEQEPAENTYEFSGLEYSRDGSTFKTTIYLSKENALKVSRLANDYEAKLKSSNSNPDDKKINVKFPTELLLLKYKGTNMPSLDYEAPEPKLASQSRTEYEEGLEAYYGAHGVNPTVAEDANFRDAYPHEKVDYRQEPPVMTNVPGNGYYEETARELAALDLGAEHGEPGLQPGEQQRIDHTDSKLGLKIGSTYLYLKDLFKSKELRSKLLKGLAVVGIGVGAIACLHANPFVTLMLAGGVGGGILGIKYLVPPVRRGYNAIKNKIKSWLFGPQLTDEQINEPAQEEPLTVEELMNRIAAKQAELQVLETDIQRLETEINGLSDDDPAKAEKQDLLAIKLREKRVILAEVSSLMHNNDIVLNEGGRSR